MPVSSPELGAALKKADDTKLYFELAEALRRVNKSGDLFEPLLTMKQKIPRKFQSPKQKIVQKGDRSLKAYAAKRDFSKTKEPAPSPKQAKRRKKSRCL